LFLTPVVHGWRAARIALIGCGPLADCTTEQLRRVATAAALGARQRRVVRIAFALRAPVDGAAAAQAVAEGLTLAAFSGDSYKSHERSGPPAEQIRIVASAETGESEAVLERAVERGRILGELLQPGSRAVQRALEHTDAIGVRRSRGGDRT
jgi:hypothetical protein